MAQSTEPDVTQRQIRVQVEFVDLSHEQLTELMFGAKPAANNTELRQLDPPSLLRRAREWGVTYALCPGEPEEPEPEEPSPPSAP